MRMEKKYLDFLFFLPAHLLLVLFTNEIINRNYLTKSPCNTVCDFSQTGLHVENGFMVGQRKWRISSTSHYHFAIVSRIKTKFLPWPTVSYTVDPGWSIQCLFILFTPILLAAYWSFVFAMYLSATDAFSHAVPFSETLPSLSSPST